MGYGTCALGARSCAKHMVGAHLGAHDRGPQQAAGWGHGDRKTWEYVRRLT
ncbi:hypothetical protein B484DRAFT_457836, partial [Ochromonadaceae sp. CCMP2298]